MDKPFNSAEYYSDLGKVQPNTYVDINTITDFMGKKEKIEHIIQYAEQCNNVEVYRKYAYETICKKHRIFKGYDCCCSGSGRNICNHCFLLDK